MKIINTKNLIDYLKIPDFTQQVDQEVITIKITKEATFQEETALLKDFPRENREVSIPQTLYLDSNNIAYILHRFSDENIFYKNISYEKSDSVFTDANLLEPLVEVTIPDELYNGGFQFYVNTNNHLVGMVEVVHLDNSKDYIHFNPENFSNFSEKTYYYNNVYGEKAKADLQITTNTLKASAHRFPILSKILGDRNPYNLSYYYKKDTSMVLPTFLLDEDDTPMIALRIGFKNLATAMSFLKETIFNYYNDVNDFRSKWRYRFLERIGYHVTPVVNATSLKNKKALIYQIPEPLYHVFYNNASLWVAVETLATGNITNILGTNEEDLLLKLLRILYYRYTNRYTDGKTDGKLSKELVAKNNEFITNLITRKVDGNLLLYKLTKDLDGLQFQTYVYFIWNIWKNSSYANSNPKTNTLIDITEKSPVLLDYRSNTIIGFHADNAQINWEGDKPEIKVTVNVKVGTKEVPKTVNIGDEKPIYIENGTTVIDNYQPQQYQYHPFAPMILVNSKNPKFLLKDEENPNTLFTKLPAFVLFANDETAFWKNILKGSEYLIDIITTVSGIGNLLKAGRLYHLLKNSKTLLFKTTQVTKAIGTAKAVAGIIEVSSGTVNTLLKLTEIDDTELGKVIAKYLFYLELASLSGEVTVAIKNGLQNSAKTIIKKSDDFNKELERLVKNGELDEVTKRKTIQEIENVSGINAKIEDFFKRVKNKGKPIREIFISDIVKHLKNITPQSTLVARGLSKRKIVKKIYDDITFEVYFKHYGGEGYASAFEYKSEMFFRENTPVDKFFNEIVHEGTHALDRAKGIINDYEKLFEATKEIIRNEEKLEKQIKKLNLDELVEFRARFFEREFQIATKQEIDFESLDEMIEYIKENYND